MKEKFKANFTGRWIEESLWGFCLLYTIWCFVMMVWFPFLAITIIKVFEINLTPFVTAIFIIVATYCGPLF